VGVFVCLVGLAALWSYDLHQSAAFAWLLAPAVFPLWTITHVTVSLAPR
jgi:hypothetical protein